MEDYIETEFTANGKIYKWVQPIEVDGELVHLGNYAPVRLLTPASKQQMISSGVNWSVNEKFSVNAEAAISNRDVNTFSQIDNSDNVGGAFKGGINFNNEIGKRDSVEPWRLDAGAYVEWNNNNFSRVERFRSVEFTRDWNIIEDQFQNFSLLGSRIELKRTENGFANTGLEYLQMDSLEGTKALLNADLKFDRLEIKEIASALQTQGNLNSDFLRHRSDVSYRLNWVKLGFQDEFETNKRLNEDSLLLSSYSFYDYQFYLANADQGPNTFKVFYRRRDDNAVAQNDFTQSAKATQYGASFGFNSNPNNTLNLTASNRKLEIIDPELINSEPENTLLLQVNHKLRSKNGWINFQTFYEVGSGLEQQREIYLPRSSGGTRCIRLERLQ